GTASSTKKMDYLIQRAKKAGIDTFVIDVYGRNKHYAANIAKVRQAGIRYVARVVVYPYGARTHQVRDRKLLYNRLARAKYAVSLGASAIQLDYIRYHRLTPASVYNELNIFEVIKFFRRNINPNVNLQIDIFGVAAHRPTRTIGQNAKLFAPVLNSINPMVYPSHYEPFRHHAVRPYSTVMDSVAALRKQLANYPNVKVFAYIELSNYRYPMSYQKKVQYIKAQMQGARDGGANGWYAWSANNHYKILFNMLDAANSKR
ncbi:MAG: hypothetical protein KDH94_06545, partial [Coxiellaceae bacterium]|nr:hypothetical protein [Coxiellaceae bacterium]